MSPNASLPTRQIGSHLVPALGYGTMGLAGAYGTMHSDEQRLAVSTLSVWSLRVLTVFQLLDELHARGVTFWDSAWRYGDSEVLLGKWFVVTRQNVFPRADGLLGLRARASVTTSSSRPSLASRRTHSVR
jgi:predicted aldo/keto reductase-like oxidoreductase